MDSATPFPLHAITLQSLTLDDLAKICTIIALILAGVGAYYKLIKGRVYTIRLEPKVVCQIFQHGNGCDLIISSHVRNVGISRVQIEQRGTGLRLLSGERQTVPTILHKVEWQPVATFAVFEDHQFVGANESIEDHQLIAVPQDIREQDFRLELWVTSQGTVWKAFNIVPKGNKRSV